ncbi:ribonuclease P/MRP protein subunit POP5 [Ambystoma mexicanum]|uniref:ribonuclease P/MRP protein subunit POP5 n=1 Tax=Ambystoma mexicanum TaxID=8296 RepID=UPI0037E74693
MVKFKSRYLLCEVVLADPSDQKVITQELLTRCVKDAIVRMHGDFGLAACTVSLSVKYLNAYTGIVLIRCRKEFYQVVWSSLPFITCLMGRNQQYPCFFNTLHVGGTIRTSQKFLIQYNQKQLLALLQNCTSQEEQDSIQRSIMSCSHHDSEEEDSQSEEVETD